MKGSQRSTVAKTGIVRSASGVKLVRYNELNFILTLTVKVATEQG